MDEKDVNFILMCAFASLADTYNSYGVGESVNGIREYAEAIKLLCEVPESSIRVLTDLIGQIEATQIKED